MRQHERNHTRRGTILAVAFGVVVIVAALLAISSERAFGVTKMENLAAAHQRAMYASEAVAALLEVRLVNLAANNDLKGLDTKPDPNYGVQYFGGCLVRWRIEPVMSRSDPTVPASDLSSPYSVNPVADSNTLQPTGSYCVNDQYYIYRIATESYLLANPLDLSGFNASNPADKSPTGSANSGAPWNNPAQRVIGLQSQRVVQLRLNSLFKYAIFYAATGATGDLEFGVGTSMGVQGAVHSNGAIYLGGQGNAWLSGNYHDACSAGGPVSIGTKTAPVTITGVAGIFRMSKVANILAVRAPAHPLAKAYSGTPPPGYVPPPLDIWRDASNLDDNGKMTGLDNLNGDTPNSSLHNFNGIPITSSNDSRSPTWVTAGPFGPYVRDSKKGATLVRTLSNIPELGGRPFESQRLVGPDQKLYDKDGDLATADFTIVEKGASQVYYAAPPTAANPPLTLTATSWPVSAEHMLLYRNTTTGDRDVHPSGALPVVDADFKFSNLPPGTEPARGYYFNLALEGDGKVPGVTGLVFRERYAQKASVFSGRVPFRSDAVYTSDDEFRAAYKKYMASQYEVWLGEFDITEDILQQGIGNCTTTTTSTTDPTVTAFIISEDSFVDMRTATGMDYFYSASGNDFTRDNSMPIVLPPPLDNKADKVNVLTLNLRAIQNYLKTRTWNDASATSSAPVTDMARDHFNGLIYAHRTRRSKTYDPINNPQYVFNRSAETTNVYEWGGLSTANHPHQLREGNGPLDTFHCAIRVANASNVDWRHDGATAAPLGTSGLTIVTSDRCYMWGHFNTTKHADAAGIDQITPCAVFADSVAALSQDWKDSDHTDATNTALSLVTTPTSYVLSYVTNNIPSDEVNTRDGGSGSVSNVIRFNEHWNDKAYSFKGSLVVMNASRYSYTTGGANEAPLTPNMNTKFYFPPPRLLSFNSDLLSRAGQPPFTPFGVQVIRTVSTVIELQ